VKISLQKFNLSTRQAVMLNLHNVGDRRVEEGEECKE
jgi:hypothetical protein